MAASDYVQLGGGLVVRLEPWVLVLELEARGIRLWREGDDIVVRPWPAVTADERVALRRWKPHILALLDYQPPGVQ